MSCALGITWDTRTSLETSDKKRSVYVDLANSRCSIPGYTRLFLSSLILHMDTMYICKYGASHKGQGELRTLGSTQGWEPQNKAPVTCLGLADKGKLDVAERG